MAIDPAKVEREGRRAYESGRARAAVWICSPVLAAGVAVAALAGFPARGVAFAAFAYLLAAAMWWRGRELARAVLPGVVAGTFLLAATFFAHGFGEHACDLAECWGHCAPMGAIGGLLTGVSLGAWGARTPSLRVARWWCASSVLAATFGCIGCTCVGFIGAIAGAAAIALVTAPAALLLSRA